MGIAAVLMAMMAPQPKLTNRTVSETHVSPAPELNFGANGALRTGKFNFLVSRLPEWHGSPVGSASIGASYQVRLTVQAGDGPDVEFDPPNVWLTMNTDRRFVLGGDPNPGIRSGTWLAEIRYISNPTTILASAVFTMEAITT